MWEMRVRQMRSEKEHQTDHGVGDAGARSSLQRVLPIAHDQVELRTHCCIIRLSISVSISIG